MAKLKEHTGVLKFTRDGWYVVYKKLYKEYKLPLFPTETLLHPKVWDNKQVKFKIITNFKNKYAKLW
jgi:hypothetical protein